MFKANPGIYEGILNRLAWDNTEYPGGRAQLSGCVCVVEGVGKEPAGHVSRCLYRQQWYSAKELRGRLTVG